MNILEYIINLKVYFLELFVKIENTPNENILILFSSMFFFMILFKLLSGKNFFLFLFILPATFFHELCHFVVSFITLGKPKNISIVPKRNETGWTLGYVESFNLNWLNQSFVALAPLLLAPIFIAFLEYSLLETNYYNLIFKGYILSNMMYGMMPSTVDWKLAIEKPIPIIFIFIVILFSLNKAVI